PKSPPMPAWAAEFVRKRSVARVERLRELRRDGLTVIGDLDLLVGGGEFANNGDTDQSDLVDTPLPGTVTAAAAVADLVLRPLQDATAPIPAVNAGGDGDPPAALRVDVGRRASAALRRLRRSGHH
ncbi:MAG: hypothetical protein ACRCYX_12160, partial [Dermatophilaceae bacterium]